MRNEGVANSGGPEFFLSDPTPAIPESETVEHYKFRSILLYLLQNPLLAPWSLIIGVDLSVRQPRKPGVRSVQPLPGGRRRKRQQFHQTLIPGRSAEAILL